MNENSKLISEIWDKNKRYVVIGSGFIPLIIVVWGAVTGYDKELLSRVFMSALVYQVAILLGMSLEIQRDVSRKEARKIAKIQYIDDFWKEGKKYKKLYLNALNGQRFIELIDTHNITVDEVKVITPNREAIETYYDYDVVVTDKKKAAASINDSIESLSDTLDELIERNIVKEYEIRRFGVFPLDFYALFDSKTCLAGKYLKDPLRKTSIGLKSLSWLEEDIQLINHHSAHFEELWDSLVVA